MSHPGPSTSSASGVNSPDASGSSAAGPAAGGELPWAFIDCPTDTLILLISHMLNLLIQHNDQVVLTPDSLTRFHSRAAPGISVLEYLRRIVKYTNMEKIPLLSLLAYIDITCQHLPTFTLSSLTVHRFLIAGVCAGSKAQCDVFCTNAHYAKVGGIKVQELNALEREFLKVTQWNLCCNADLLQRYYTSLIRSHGGYTQAPEPAVRPFMSFPRSMSKPPSDADEDMGDSDAEGGGMEGIEDEAGQEEGDEGEGTEVSISPESSKRRSLDVTGMIVDTNGVPSPTSPIPIDNKGRGGRRPGGHLGHSHSSSSQGQDIMGRDDGMDVDESPASPATSSIPSSTRSSIRGGPKGSRGRISSLSYSDARLAEPQLDRTTASGSPFRPPRQSISTSPVEDLARTQHAAPQPSTTGPEDPDARPGPDVQPTQDGLTEHDQEGDQHPHHHHGPSHLLKSIGGIFHRHKHTHSDKAHTPSSDSAHPRTVSENDITGVNGFSSSTGVSSLSSLHSSNPKKSTNPSETFETPPVPSMAPPNTGAISRPQVSRDTSAVRSPRTHASPGLAKPVTPRVRTRDELSETAGLHGVPGLGEVAVASNEGSRRARVE